MAKLESILYFIEEAFGVSDFPDYPHALNGLQVEGPEEVKRLAAGDCVGYDCRFRAPRAIG